MEDHLKNKQRLEQEWVGLCGYEAEPSSTTVAFKAENKKKNRYPDKLPYDHNRVILNALVNATNSDYINASTVVSDGLFACLFVTAIKVLWVFFRLTMIQEIHPILCARDHLVRRWLTSGKWSGSKGVLSS